MVSKKTLILKIRKIPRSFYSICSLLVPGNSSLERPRMRCGDRIKTDLDGSY
jgi:hypothetical protein